MAKKWAEVIASPDYQALSAPDKAAAQDEYFNTVVKPNLSADDVDAAHTEFYTQYPVGSQASQEAPQATQTQTQATTQPNPVEAPTEPQAQPQSILDQVGNTAAGMGRILAGVPVSLANAGIGVVNTIGEGVQQASNAVTGETGQYQPIARAGYGQLDQYLAPRGAAEQIGSDIGATLVAAPAMGAEVAASEGAPLLARVGTALGRNASASVVPTMAQHTTGQDSSEALKDMAVNTLLGTTLEGVGSKAVDTVRRMLPEGVGGYSTAQRAAEVVNPDYLNKVLQGGDTEAQQVFRTGTTDEAGNSILNPSQVFDPVTGKKYIAAEQRDLTRGSASPYAQRLEQQASGAGIERAVGQTVTPGEESTLQAAAQRITAAHKAKMNELYNTSKDGAQEILNKANVSQLKLPNTKALAIQHLEDNAASGNIKLTPEVRKTLKAFTNDTTKIKNVNDLDQFKRLFNEQRGKAIKSGDYTSANVMGEMVDTLRGEGDSLLTSIDPAAGSLYRDADQAWAETVDDYGKKSILSKISNNANPDTAGNVLFNGQNAAFNTQQVADALRKGGIPDADQLAAQLGQGIGEQSRINALNAANTGENFSPTKFVNSLNKTEPQAQIASDISPRNESNLNNALADVVRAQRDRATVSTATRDNLINGLTRVAGGSAGAAVAGPGGAVVGQEAAARVATTLKQSGLLDKFANKRGIKYMDYLADPANAAKVDEILQASKGRGLESASKSDVTNIIDNLKRAGIVSGANNIINGDDYSNPYGNLPQVKQQAQPEPAPQPVAEPEPQQQEPEQQAQAAKLPEVKGSPQAIDLYRSISDAETGNEDNRFIRTKVKSGPVSSAFGPAQITYSLAKDFADRHSDLFDDEEKEYLGRLVDQGRKMLHADSNDPIYGHGGTGTVAETARDKRLYANVAVKMLDYKIKDNNGHLDQTLRNWRGANDQAYFDKVVKSYARERSKRPARKGWSR
ncbi:hypothetical protein N2U02_004485 [Salmonella enterica]|nr:hypothetical protein [Salmonella enterica]